MRRHPALYVRFSSILGNIAQDWEEAINRIETVVCSMKSVVILYMYVIMTDEYVHVVYTTHTLLLQVLERVDLPALLCGKVSP